jgi:hypothetical protein
MSAGQATLDRPSTSGQRRSSSLEPRKDLSFVLPADLRGGVHDWIQLAFPLVPELVTKKVSESDQIEQISTRLLVRLIILLGNHAILMSGNHINQTRTTAARTIVQLADILSEKPVQANNAINLFETIDQGTNRGLF